MMQMIFQILCFEAAESSLIAVQAWAYEIECREIFPKRADAAEWAAARSINKTTAILLLLFE